VVGGEDRVGGGVREDKALTDGCLQIDCSFLFVSSFLDSKKVKEIARPDYRPSNQVCC